MVPKAIQNTTALRALQVLLRETYPEPPPEHGDKEARVVVQFGLLAGSSVQEKSGTFGTEERQVRAAGLARVLGELRKSVLIHCLGKFFLRDLLCAGCWQPVIIVHAPVVSIKGRSFG
jgi:hypothetical protein